LLRVLVGSSAHQADTVAAATSRRAVRSTALIIALRFHFGFFFFPQR
jgi:hypothetical protein